MRTITVIGVVLGFGVAFGMMSGAGVDQAIFGLDSGAIDGGTEQALSDISSDADGNISADTAGDNEPTVTGFAIQGASFVMAAASAVGLLPITLVNLGFPTYFAYPVGAAAQIIAFIGVLQFLTGREYL